MTRRIVALLRIARLAYRQRVRDLYRADRVDAAVVLEQVADDITRLIQAIQQEERHDHRL